MKNKKIIPLIMAIAAVVLLGAGCYQTELPKAQEIGESARCIIRRFHDEEKKVTCYISCDQIHCIPDKSL